MAMGFKEWLVKNVKAGAEKQRTDYDCGPIVVCQVAKLVGKPCDMQLANKLCEPDWGHGTTTETMSSALSALSIGHTVRKDMRVVDLMAAVQDGHPVIIAVTAYGDGHWALAHGVTPQGGLIVFDPYHGSSKLFYADEIDERWTSREGRDYLRVGIHVTEPCQQEKTELGNESKETLRASRFRIGSPAYVSMFAKARAGGDVDDVDRAILDETEIGNWAEYDGTMVPLDVPMHEPYGPVEQNESVRLNVPRRGGKKKFYVYVRDPKDGKVIKVEFGYPGMKVRTSDLLASKNFASRHGCEAKKDKTTPGYWSCVLPRYAKALGLSEPAYKYW